MFSLYGGSRETGEWPIRFLRQSLVVDIESSTTTSLIAWLLSILVAVRSRWSNIRCARSILIKWRCSCSAPWRFGWNERLRNAWHLRSWVHMIPLGNQGRPVMPCGHLATRGITLRELRMVNDGRNHSGVSWLRKVIRIRTKSTTTASGWLLWSAAA